MTRLITTCIAGILLGIVAISLPLAITYRTDLAAKQNALSQDNILDRGNGELAGGSFWTAALGVGLIATLALVLASSALIILKRHMAGHE